MKRLAKFSALFVLCMFCTSNDRRVELLERVYRMPAPLLKSIRQAVQESGSQCKRKLLFSRDFFELTDKRLLILIGIPDYLCKSNSFMPVSVDDRGDWRAGALVPGAPSWMVLGPDNALWLATQWQVEGTFPALYRSPDGLAWREIKLPENREVDCCFERLERICFRQGIVRLKFVSAVTAKKASWEAEVDGLADALPAWKKTGGAPEGDREHPCPFVPARQGPWARRTAARSGEVIFEKKDRYSKIAVVIPGALE